MSNEGFLTPTGQLTGKGKAALTASSALPGSRSSRTSFFKTIPAGHVGVATLFGEIKSKRSTQPGLQFPVNPLLSWTEYDVRDKEHKEVASVPSRDQLTTEIDVSVVYRVMPNRAARL